MNNKHKNILLKIGFLTLMVGFAVLLLIAKIKREQTFKSDANIKINHLDGNYLIDEQTILNTIKRKFPINQKIDTRYLENLEKVSTSSPYFKNLFDDIKFKIAAFDGCLQLQLLNDKHYTKTPYFASDYP